MDTARDIIRSLDLQPHPEGGWYAETFREESGDGRGAATAIHFLLESGQRSHWHRVDATEIWLWHGGDPLELSIASDDAGPTRVVMLGTELSAGEQPHVVVPPYAWQAAAPAKGSSGYSLVSCVVAPAFEFEGFKLAPPDWQPDS